MGKKIKGIDKMDIPAEFSQFKKGMYASQYRLTWDVPYEPGEIKVVAYNDGVIAATKVIKTAGPAAKLELSPDRTVIAADGSDLSYITVTVRDKNGNICPKADHLINFEISGTGKLAAVGNGDPTSVASFQDHKRKAFSGKCLLIVRSTKQKGEIKIVATSESIQSTTVIIISE